MLKQNVHVLFWAVLHTSVQVHAHLLRRSLLSTTSFLVRLSGKCCQLLQVYPAIATVLHGLLSVSQLSLWGIHSLVCFVMLFENTHACITGFSLSALRYHLVAAALVLQAM